ncbi:MAG: hypothetical protein JSS30_02215 [Verrucomicrobia bacterium]|nr:hypothetical protein [Verrucomicrobiota bacterium]
MTRVSDIRFSTAPSFEPTAQAREFGEKVPDTITSATPAVEQGEGFFMRMICCIPRCILSVMKKVACLLTLGYYCNTKTLSEKERRENILTDLVNVHKIWTFAPTKIEKKEAAEALFQKYPELKENIAVFGVNQARRNALGHFKEPVDADAKAARQKEIEEFNAKHYQSYKNQQIEALEFNFDALFLMNYIKFLREQIENA